MDASTCAVALRSQASLRLAGDDLTEWLGRAETQSSLITRAWTRATSRATAMLSRDVSWSVPLLSLPGRNGLDPRPRAFLFLNGSGRHSGPYFYFDEDNGFPSPGFRLGFPSVQRRRLTRKPGKMRTC
jgi:hypothetical protein